MNYVRLGGSGLRVSPLCLGCMSYGDPARGHHSWVLDEEASRPFIRQALEAGLNFFDTANFYSLGASEEVVGRALRDFARRDEVVLATKVFFPVGEGAHAGGLSRKSIMHQIDASLKRLGTDYVDLYQVHRWDPETPLQETLEALHDVVRAGKARYLGASSMFAWQFGKSLAVAQQHGWTRYISMQNLVNLIYREEEREMLPLCRDQGIGIMPWSPLARGRLARPWNSASTSRSASDKVSAQLFDASDEIDRPVVDALEAVAAERGVPMSQVALAWLRERPGISSPIIGATRPQHLSDALASLELTLSADERARLESPYVPHPVVGFS